MDLSLVFFVLSAGVFLKTEALDAPMAVTTDIPGGNSTTLNISTSFMCAPSVMVKGMNELATSGAEGLLFEYYVHQRLATRTMIPLKLFQLFMEALYVPLVGPDTNVKHLIYTQILVQWGKHDSGKPKIMLMLDGDLKVEPMV